MNPQETLIDQAHRVDRAQTFKILVKADDAVSDLSRCDFTFTPVDLAYANRDKYCRLPDWVYYLDWAAYQAAAGGLSEQPLPASYTPQAVCARLYGALVAAAEADTPAERSYQTPTPNTPAPRPVASPLAEPARLPKLTIGMATYDDFDGVYFTIQAIRLSHPEILAETEFLILDNHPEGTCATPLQQFAQSIPRCRYVTHRDARGTASRDFIFRAAEADYVLCVDSHVLLAPGSLRQFIDFLEQRPDCRDLLQGPLIYDDLCNASTHFEPVWSAGMYGVWGSDVRGLDPTHDPFEIPMQGLGIFGCRKTAWLGFNPRFSGFGGEEGYIHEKFRQQGRKTLCLPFLRWVHRFHRPFGTRYQNTWKDRIRNYYIGFQELGLDTTPIDKHFQVLLGDEAYGRIKSTLDAELASPWFYFDAIYCISRDTHRERWETMQQAFQQLGIAHRIRRFSAVETSESPHLDRALAHRAIIKNAAQCGLKNVLVFEEDAIVLPYTLLALTKAIEELKTLPWTLFQCGVLNGGESFPKAAGCQYLLNPDEAFTESSAIAYHHSLYAKILGDLPEDIPDLRQWLCLHDGIDRYLSTVGGRYLTTPSVSSPSS